MGEASRSLSEWRRPDAIYAIGMGLLWAIFVGLVFGIYAFARIKLGLPLTFSALILGLGMDLALQKN